MPPLGTVAAHPVARGVDHHSVEPSRKAALAPVGGEPGGEADADILCQVRRRLVIAEHARTHAVDHPVVAFDERGERLPVSSGGPVNQRTVRVLSHAAIMIQHDVVFEG